MAAAILPLFFIEDGSASLGTDVAGSGSIHLGWRIPSSSWRGCWQEPDMPNAKRPSWKKHTSISLFKGTVHRKLSGVFLYVNTMYIKGRKHVQNLFLDIYVTFYVIIITLSKNVFNLWLIHTNIYNINTYPFHLTSYHTYIRICWQTDMLYYVRVYSPIMTSMKFCLTCFYKVLIKHDDCIVCRLGYGDSNILKIIDNLHFWGKVGIRDSKTYKLNLKELISQWRGRNSQMHVKNC